jgi:putative transposase
MNAVVNIAVGAAVECDGKRLTITHLLDLDTVLAQEEGSETTTRLHVKDLAPPAHQQNDNEPETDLTTVSDDDWQEAKRRLQIIRPLLGTRRKKESVTEQARSAGVHYVTIYRWIDAYEREGRLSALLPNRPPGGRGKSRLLPETEAIIKATIEDYYLNVSTG